MYLKCYELNKGLSLERRDKHNTGKKKSV